MKRLLSIIFLILLIIFFFLYFKKEEDVIENEKKLEIVLEKELVNITDYYVYGNHFNIEGNINLNNSDIKNYSLILKNSKKEIKLDCIFQNKDNSITFKTSDYINKGINLDDLKIGNWSLFIKYQDDNTNKYYGFINNTHYDDIEYYTITKNNTNNKINIIFDKNNNFVNFIVKKSSLPDDVYDITIDPGHGGVDTGASGRYEGVIYNEADLTLKIAIQLKKDLEKNGYKVKLTRENDMDIDNYGDTGRSVIPNKYHSKLCLSLHLNSGNSEMSYGGLEIYTPNDVDYSLARLLASNLSSVLDVSKKKFNRIENGIYFNGFTKESIQELNEQYLKQKYNIYDIKIGAPEMFMIREVGGKATYAYVDGRNSKHGKNIFYNSNQTAESYLLELGYITYSNDLKKIIEKGNLISEQIKKAITDYY